MGETTRLRSRAEAEIEAHFEAMIAGAPRAEQAWRSAAFDTFRREGLPSRRNEQWHYTDLRRLLDAPSPAQAAAASAAPFGAEIEATLIEVTAAGDAIAPRKLPKGVAVSTLRDAWMTGDELNRIVAYAGAENDSVVALNTAFAEHGVVIDIAANCRLDRPIHLRFGAQGGAAQYARVILRVGAGAEATLISSHVEREGSHPCNTLVEIRAGKNAKVEHVRVGLSGAASRALSTLAVSLHEGTELTSFNLMIGGALNRHQIFARFDGEGGRLTLSGATLLRDAQHADTTLVVDHAAPNCVSRERFKHIVDGQATGVYQGKIIVRPGAQKTDGGMKSDAILLGPEARMHNKPELEIFADDVVCGHGATCGALDDDQLFYLRARGLPKAEAETLLLEAFAGEAIETVSHEGLREALARAVSDWLGRRSS
ncbi:MAG: Fe-S cluster assembly protein SufD [Methylobacteriaceae bacterium]|nr:Fe-S cluster assembly protein SufD [Methylobacteriaceae bacterium]